MKRSVFEERWNQVNQEIDATLTCSLRNRSGLTLIAVSKRQPLSAVNMAYQFGVRDFGENQIQEGVPKVKSAPKDIHWHFIGHLQRNKVREAVKNFQFIHSVDSQKLMDRIDNIAGEERLFPDIFLQVNLLNDMDKQGYQPDHVQEALGNALALRNVHCIGLMGIPPLGLDDRELCGYFQKMADLRNDLQKTYPPWPGKLSMGMSADYPLAIKAGSHFIRVGSSLFGERE